jgi:Ni,Fe-hydrogenase III small subunit
MKLVHLVNRAIGDEINGGEKALIHTHRYNYVNTNIPARGNFSIRLKSETQPADVLLIPGNVKVNWKYENNEILIDVPEFKLHEIIVIKG